MNVLIILLMSVVIILHINILINNALTILLINVLIILLVEGFIANHADHIAFDATSSCARRPLFALSSSFVS